MLKIVVEINKEQNMLDLFVVETFLASFLVSNSEH